VSQSPLSPSTPTGAPPSYPAPAPPAVAAPRFAAFVRALEQELARPVPTGLFGADMQVFLINDGPVTICLDTALRE
jgi:D-tyrosyl-tRNA(Tyr) deacylase